MADRSIGGRQALAGIKVADFGWIAAGPLVTKCLADHGATVVKVESIKRIDMARVAFPYAGGVPGINRSTNFASANPGKYGVTINLKHPRGLGIAKRLVAWSDVVVENFTAGTMERLGLGYEDIQEARPDVIMLRTSSQGQTGPYAPQPGMGTVLQGLSGFTRFFGWPDRAPVQLPHGYTDWIAAWYGVVAVMGALDYRRRTGRGQCIDLSQFEASLSFLSPAILDYTANRRVQSAEGNAHPWAAPHGVYRCQGDNRWCAIAVFDCQEWEAFRRVIGEPEWGLGPRFSTFLSRKHNEAELNRLVEEWTVKHSAEDVMEKMQKAGVAAGVVEDGKDLHEDRQLKHRHHFWMLDHPEMGVTAYDGAPFRLSETPGELTMPAPCLGQHTEYVCRQMLGVSDEDFVELLAEGALM